jgi:MtN3 and saliva related transmembrane protein
MLPPTQEIIGALAALLTTTSFVPQVVRTIRTRDTRAISLWMYLMFCAGVALWWVYGALLGSWPIMLANGVTLVLAGAVLSLKIRQVLSSGRHVAAPLAESE